MISLICHPASNESQASEPRQTGSSPTSSSSDKGSGVRQSRICRGNFAGSGTEGREISSRSRKREPVTLFVSPDVQVVIDG